MPIWADDGSFSFDVRSTPGERAGVSTIDMGIIDALFTADGVYSIYEDSVSSPYYGRVANVDTWAPPCQAGGAWHRNSSSVLTMGMTGIAGKTAPQLWSNYLNAHMVAFSTTASMANSHSHGLTAYGAIPAGLGDGQGSYQADGSHPYYQEIGGVNITLLTLSPGHLLEGCGVWVVDYDLGGGTPVDTVMCAFAAGVHKNKAANTYNSFGFSAGSIGAQQTTYAPSAAFVGWGGWQRGLDLSLGTFNAGAIRMSATSDQGSIIEYDSNDYSMFSGNTFLWRIAGADVLAASATGVVVAAIKVTTGASAGYVLTSDADGDASWAASSGVFALVDDTTPQLGGQLDINGKYFTNSVGPTGDFYMDFTAATATDSKYNVLMASGASGAGVGLVAARYRNSATALIQMYHNNTAGILASVAGNLNLNPAGGTVAVTGGITTTTTVAATGNVTGANLAVTNWNTAYGWGDHAGAGYLKNLSEDSSPQLGAKLDLVSYGLQGIHSGNYNSVCADGQDGSHSGAFSAWVGTARSVGIGMSHDGTKGYMNTTSGNLDLQPASSLSINGAVISYGANDSGGAGYKVLRVPN